MQPVVKHADDVYTEAGAEVAGSLEECVKGADIVLTVSPLSDEQIAALPEAAVVLGMLDPANIEPKLPAYEAKSPRVFFKHRVSTARRVWMCSLPSNPLATAR